jgi:hypothetical protein
VLCLQCLLLQSNKILANLCELIFAHIELLVASSRCLSVPMSHCSLLLTEQPITFFL